MIGPFPQKSPAEYIRENIVGDRAGIPLMVNLTIVDTKNNCKPLTNVLIDIWQCDAKGDYSEYDEQLNGDFTKQHFLRGRQTTKLNGKVQFFSIYPGWYPGRAPHIHLEVRNANEKSLLVTQIAFPNNLSNSVYTNSLYNGLPDTTNKTDFIFEDSLSGNMADTVTGDATNGYILNKIIKV